MHSLLTKRFEMPETWFDALMFAFKLPAVILPVGLLVWYVFLPPLHSLSSITYYDELINSPTDDFISVAFQLSGVFFLSALALIVGGLVQLFRYSRWSAGWSLSFGIFALVVGIVLANASLPERGVEVIMILKKL
jgi:hypothetical protein